MNGNGGEWTETANQKKKRKANKTTLNLMLCKSHTHRERVSLVASNHLNFTLFMCTRRHSDCTFD